MKKIIFIALLAFTFSANAQYKIGYTNIEYIIESHPKMKEIRSVLETETSILEKEIQTLTQEFQQKYQQYQQAGQMMSDIVKADKEKELQDLQARIEDLQKNAQIKLMQKQDELLAPVLEEIEKAINTVAEETGYDYVLNGASSQGMNFILYAKKKEDNLTKLIFGKLGIPYPESEEATATK